MAKTSDPACMIKFDSVLSILLGLAGLAILIYFTVEYAKKEHCGKLADLSLAYVIISWVGMGLACFALCCMVIAGGALMGASMSNANNMKGFDV
jgi:hypothetical protein